MEEQGPGGILRWLGWLLAISGGLLTLLVALIWIVLAVFTDEPWADVAWVLIGLTAIGVMEP